MSTRRIARRRLLGRIDPVLGLLVVTALALFTYISYNADSGLPLQRTYDISVQLPNADRLIKTDEVRIGGVRVGQVTGVTASRPQPGRGVYAIVHLALNRSVAPLPADTHVEVQAASVLGQTYVDLTPGTSRQTIPGGGTLPLREASSTVELTDLLDIFNHATSRAIQSTAGSYASALSGRGTQLNALIDGTAAVLPPLQQLATTLASSTTRLAGFLHGTETLAAALSPVSRTLPALLGNASTTLGGLVPARAALGATIDDAAPAFTGATRALNTLARPLDSLAGVIHRLREVGPRLPAMLSQVNSTLSAGVAPLRELPAFSAPLRSSLQRLTAFSTAPDTLPTLHLLSTAMTSAQPLLTSLAAAQTSCDVIGIWGPNFASTFGAIGVGQGPSMANIGLTTLGAKEEELQHAAPSPNIAINYQPHENASECESGNEPYNNTQQLANPPGNQSTAVPHTTPPAGVLDLARGAGLLNAPKGTPR